MSPTASDSRPSPGDSLPLSTARNTHIENIQAGGDQPVTIQAVSNAVRKWWKLALPISLALAVLVAGLAFMLSEPKYQASSWLRVDETPPIVAFEHRGGNERSYAETQVELVRSPVIMSRAAATPEVAELLGGDIESRTRWLARHVRADRMGTSELMRVSIEDSNPKLAAAVVNRVVDQYFEFCGLIDADRTQRTIELLSGEQQRRSAEVADLRVKVREMTQRGGSDASAGDSPLLQSNAIADLQRRLTTAEVDQEMLKAQITALEEALAGDKLHPPEAAIQRAIGESREVSDLQQRITEKRTRLHEIEARSAMGHDDPLYRHASVEIKTDEESLAQIKTALAERVQAEMETSVHNSRKEELAIARVDLQKSHTAVDMLRNLYAKELDNVKLSSGDVLALEFKRAELSRAEAVSDMIAERLLELRTERGAPGRTVLLKVAETPTTPFEPGSYQKIILASLFGFCIPFALAVFWERLARHVIEPEDIKRYSNTSVIGEVPRLPERRNTNGRSTSKQFEREQRMFEESIDGLRTSLMLSDPLRNMRVLAVASAVKQEGKTSVASQLAVSIARSSGQPTLLVDGDMRSPDVHHMFDLPVTSGLAEVLAGKCKLFDAIISVPDQSIDVLPSGKLSASPHKLLGNGEWKHALDELCSRYRYIIIDTPPVLAASEALVLTKAADASILCVMRDVSRLEQVKAASERFSAAGIYPLGTVLNGIPSRRYSYQYSSYAE